MRVEDITGRAKKALPYVFTGLIGTNLGEAIRISEGTNASEKILSFMQVFPEAFKNFLPSFHPFDLLIGAACCRYICPDHSGETDGRKEIPAGCGVRLCPMWIISRRIRRCIRS